MTTVTVYRSTDTGAPSLTGVAGAILTVLDAVLVNGYNSNNPAGAGWTKPFSNSGNIGCYRNSAVDGTGFHLHIDDSGTGNTAKEAIACGFETLSALSTGTGQFPTAAQLNLDASSTPTGGVTIRKSTTADSTARAWTIVADDTCFYLFAETGDFTNPTGCLCFMFGDIFSYKSSDAYRCMIIGRNIANSSSTFNEAFSALQLMSSTILTTTMVGHFMARSWTTAGGSIPTGKHIDYSKMGVSGPNGSTTGTSNLNAGAAGVLIGFNNTASCFPYPNGPDGGLYLSPVWVHHSNAVRGYLKGLWAPLHSQPLNHNDTYSGTGTLSGKSFLVLNIMGTQANLSNYGQAHIETSSTWS